MWGKHAQKVRDLFRDFVASLGALWYGKVILKSLDKDFLLVGIRAVTGIGGIWIERRHSQDFA
jgi:hypothetical protein